MFTDQEIAELIKRFLRDLLEAIEYEPLFTCKELHVYGHCAYISTAAFRVLKQLGSLVKIMVAFGTRLEEEDEDEVNCLIHTVVAVEPIMELDFQNGTTEEFILDTWIEAWESNPNNKSASCAGVDTFDIEEEFWEKATIAGSPKEEALVQFYVDVMRQALREWKGGLLSDDVNYVLKG